MTDKSLKTTTEHKVITEDLGYSAAWSYSTVEAEYHALRTGLGLLDLSHWTRIEARGADAKQYLHARTSQSITDLEPGMGRAACLLDAKGRMLALMSVHALRDRLLILASPALRESLPAELEKYVFDEDVQFRDLSDDTRLLALEGPQALDYADVLGGASLVAEHTACESVWREHPLALVRVDNLAKPGMWILIDGATAEEAIPDIRREGINFGGGAVGVAAWHIARVESGKPLYGLDLDGTIIPLEAGLAGALDYKKGCYPGQEIIARITNLAHPAKSLIGLRFGDEKTEPPHRGAEILGADGKSVGAITSVARSPELQQLVALGYVKWDLREESEFRVGDHAARRFETPLWT